MTELFDPKGYESIKLKISLNNTTKKSLINPRRVKLVEILERGFVLEVPPSSCEKGHYLVMQAEAVTPDNVKYELKSGAKVEEIDPSGRVTLSLLQHDKEAWEAFQGLFAARQDDILKFFEAAKG